MEAVSWRVSWMGADGIDGERSYCVTTSTLASAANLSQLEAMYLSGAITKSTPGLNW